MHMNVGGMVQNSRRHAKDLDLVELQLSPDLGGQI